jgi:hypothetical protein
MGRITAATKGVDCCEYCKAAGTFGATAVLKNHCQQWFVAMLRTSRYTPRTSRYTPRTSCYKPRNRAELVACLIGLGDYRLVSLSPEAAMLLQRHRVHTIKDVLGLPAWPYGRLRIAITRWSFGEVLIEPV